MIDQNYQDALPEKNNGSDQDRANVQNVRAFPENEAQNYPYPVSAASRYPYQSQNNPSAYQPEPGGQAPQPNWSSSPTSTQMPFAHPYSAPGAPIGYGAADSGGQTYTPAFNPPKPKTTKTGFGQRGGNVVLAALAALLVFGGIVFFLATNFRNSTSTSSGTLANAPTVAAASPAAASPAAASSTGQLNVRQVAEQVRPAVVQITTSQNTNVDSTNPFFGSGNGSSTSQETGVGSGVIYDQAGYILTNYHVVNGADSLLVTLPDGRSFDGKVVGSDYQTDLAVVKIDPKGANLPLAQLGDSSSLHVGDGVVAIGNALALPGGPTVTSGVVSALERSVTEPGTQQTNSPFGGSATTAGPQLYGLVQTDAAINPGNSGGALVDMQGQVIGINTLAAGQAEPGVQAQGIGFAISVNQAKQIAQQLVASGKVSHPFLGISYQPLTPALAAQLKLDATQAKQSGAVTMQVQSGSPAAQAGIKRGDIILAIDGQKLTSESALGQILNTHKPGDHVKLEVVTPGATGGNNQSRTVDVTLSERPANT